MISVLGAEKLSLVEIEAFLAASESVRFVGSSRLELYNLRHSPRYGLRHYEKTRPTAVQIGERPTPRPSTSSIPVSSTLTSTTIALRPRPKF
jgi:hypothetical protein